MRAHRIPTILLNSRQVKRGEESSPGFTSDKSGNENSETARWFDRALTVGCEGIKMLVLAECLDVSESYLSQMRSGVKPVAARHLAALKRHYPQAFLVYLQEAARGSQVAVEPRHALTRAEVLEALMVLTWDSEPMLKMMRRAVAEMLRVTEAEVEQALGFDGSR